jgi:hypothetical protein
MQLRYHGYDVAGITFGGMFGQKAVGGWSLKFSLTFHPKQIPQGPVVDYQVAEVQDLRVHVSVSSTAGPVQPLGIAHCLQQRFFTIHQYSSQEGRLFELVLSAGQLAGLEEMRAGGGLKFKFDIYARGEGTRGPEPLQAEFTKDFNLSEWTKLLMEMGAAEYLCVAVLLPACNSDNPHAPAIAYVRRAQDFLVQGEYRAAVASCREALEVLTGLQDKAAGTDGPHSTAAVLSAYRTSRSDMSRAQRLVFLRIATNNLTHLGHHPPERSEDVLSRQDAALTITTCAGLISASMTEGLVNHPEADGQRTDKD